MQREHINNNQNPAGIWQGIWANLIIEFNIQMAIRTYDSYISAWEIIQNLIEEIPTECKDDAKKAYDEVTKVMDQPVSHFSTVMAISIKRKFVCSYAPIVLRGLMGNIVKSLHVKGWINKPDFGAQPKFEKKGHL